MPALSQNLIFHVNNGNTTTNTVVVDYPNTATTTLVYKSDKVKGDGYFGGSDGLHTVAFTASRYFHGTITMQATLASEPVETDWFNIYGTTSTYTPLNSRSTSTVDIYNFTGNFVWVRGYIAINEGTVSVIQYNH
jgi:hypothetical protein